MACKHSQRRQKLSKIKFTTTVEYRFFTYFFAFSRKINLKFIIELLWVAPELLPLTSIPGTPATQKGDVYSFAIILEEIVVRGGPFEDARQTYDVQTILDRIIAHETTPFRPFIGQRECPPDVFDLMEKCWADNPEERPPFSAIRSSVRRTLK